MPIKVCKFGGTSMADASVIKTVKKIIESDTERRAIVVSAPGKRYSGDIKVTDLLYACHACLVKGGSLKSAFAPVRNRLISIVEQLNLDFDIISLLNQTERRIEQEHSLEFTASRGEFLCAQIIAKLLGAKFIDAENVIFFDKYGILDGAKSYKAISAACKNCKKAVIPGFYGMGANGKIKTFSRGGGDVAGAIVARALGASVYENWTDVNGFLACDPQIVPNAKLIKKITYRELRELSYMGATVVHGDSVLPVREAGIPIQIKNTFNPMYEGTSIVPDCQYIHDSNPVVGIAGKKGYTVIYVEKSIQVEELRFIADVLGVFNRANISVEHAPSSVDGLSVVVDGARLSEDKLQAVIDDINRAVAPNLITVTENISLISTVEVGIGTSAETFKRLFSAISNANVKVKLISQCSSGINVIVGVDNADCERCIRAIYHEFFN